MRKIFIILTVVSCFFSLTLYSNQNQDREKETLLHFDETVSPTPDAVPDITPSEKTESSSLSPKYESIMSYIIKILLFIVLLLILSFFVKKFYGKKVVISNISEVVDVLGVKSLTHNKFLYLVQFGSRFILLGVTDNNIEKISEIINKEEVDKIKLMLNINTDEKDFSEILKDNYIKNDKISKFKQQLKDILKK